MCQLCSLPTNHDNDLELLGYLTLAAWTSTALLGVWWWRVTRLLRIQQCSTAPATKVQDIAQRLPTDYTAHTIRD